MSSTGIVKNILSVVRLIFIYKPEIILCHRDVAIEFQLARICPSVSSKNTEYSC